MSKFTCLFVCVVAISCGAVYAVSEEEKSALLEAFKPIVTECSQSHGVSDDEIKAAKEAVSTDGINPCFMGCVLKKTEVLDAQGKFDVDKGLSQLKKFVKSDEDFAKFEEIGKQCTSVNDQAVGDGDQGCERAKLLMECFLQNKAKLPL